MFVAGCRMLSTYALYCYSWGMWYLYFSYGPYQETMSCIAFSFKTVLKNSFGKPSLAVTLLDSQSCALISDPHATNARILG